MSITAIDYITYANQIPMHLINQHDHPQQLN